MAFPANFSITPRSQPPSSMPPTVRSPARIATPRAVSRRERGSSVILRRTASREPMQCPKCGADNLNDAANCAACRSDLSDLNLTAARANVGSSPISFDLVRPTAVGSAERALHFSRGITEGADLGDRYHVVQRLGEGGMGEGFLVRDRAPDRDAALKVIRVDLASHPAILDRFKREIQLSSNITHKNVLRV